MAEKITQPSLPIFKEYIQEQKRRSCVETLLMLGLTAGIYFGVNLAPAPLIAPYIASPDGTVTPFIFPWLLYMFASIPLSVVTADKISRRIFSHK